MVLVAESLTVGVDGRDGKGCRVQRVDAFPGRAARVCLFAEKPQLLADKAARRACNHRARLRGVCFAVHHHGHVDIVKSAFRDELLLTAEILYFARAPQPGPPADLNVFLRGRRQQAYAARKAVRHGPQAHSAAQHGGKLGVVPAGVGRACGFVRKRMAGAEHRVQLPDNGHPRPRAAPKPAFHACARGPRNVRQTQRGKGLQHLSGRARFLIAQLRMGKDIPPESGEALCLCVDGGARRALERVCHCVHSPLTLSMFQDSAQRTRRR